MLIDATADETREMVRQLYSAFPSGEEFEAFLKILLNMMRLEDVTVTRYSRDGGIDLTARRTGLEELSRVDEVRYIVQAKRYAPDRTIPIESVRALRGVLRANDKGLFITTGKFSSGAETFAEEDTTRPIVLIDGERLVRLCIEHKLGFRFRPIFDANALHKQLQPIASTIPTTVGAPTTRTFVKTVTANDIRARIISIPWELDSLLPPDADEITVAFPSQVVAKCYNYRRDRRYIAGVTDVLRKLGLLGANDERIPRVAEWVKRSDSDVITVRIAAEAT